MNLPSAADAAELVRPYVEVGDAARESLKIPTAGEKDGRGYVVATDGHTLHAVRCDEWQSMVNPHGPPWQMIVPWDAKQIGIIALTSLDVLKHYPKPWKVLLEMKHDLPGNMECKKYVGSGKKARWQTVVERCVQSWVPPMELLPHEDSFGVNGQYLRRAVKFVDERADVTVAGTYDIVSGVPKFNPLGPIVLYYGDALRDSQRFAIVMPTRL